MPYPCLHSSLSTGGACVNKLACGTVLRTWPPSLDFQLPTVLGQLSRRRKGPLKQRSTETRDLGGPERERRLRQCEESFTPSTYCELDVFLEGSVTRLSVCPVLSLLWSTRDLGYTCTFIHLPAMEWGAYRESNGLPLTVKKQRHREVSVTLVIVTKSLSGSA